MTTAYQVIPLAKLHESPLNPRRTYEPKALEDLTASVKAKGIITPLLVRPNAQGFEIAAGHRRYRAAKAAGLTEVPAVVRPMDDVDFLEILVLENDEREDLHPLEEAEGYRTLMTKAGYTAERLAERRGCSVKFIYDRVKLLALIPAAQKLFRANTFTAGHAILLARLTPKDQQRAIGDAKDGYGDGGLLKHEDVLWDPEDQGRVKESVKPVSVRELEAWIDEHVRFDAAKVDPMLFPETAAALRPAQEQAEKVVKITHDNYIQQEARDEKERTYGPRSWTRADGTHKSKPCEHAVTDVIVVGPGRGEAFRVCVNKDKCATHWGAEKRARARRTSRGQVGGSQTGARPSWKREQEKQQREQARRDAEVARWKKALPTILDAVAAAVKKAPARANGLLGAIVLEACTRRDYGHKDYTGLVPRGTTAEDLVRHAAFAILANDSQDYQAAEQFPRRAKAFGIDVKKIVDEVAPAPAPAKVQTPARGAGEKK